MSKLISSASFSISKSDDLENSDAVLMPKKVGNGYLFAVADGVGKSIGAQKASQIAIEVLDKASAINEKLDLENYFHKIRKEFISISSNNSNYYNMATTLTACYVTEHAVQYAHTGDSRLYILKNGKLSQKTQDQTEHAYLISQGIITEKQSKTLSRSNVLMSALSPKMDVNINKGSFKLKSRSSSLILMTDGAYRFWEKNPKFSKSTMDDINIFASSLKKRILTSGPIDDFSFVAGEFQ